jgi:heme/copper-type cytochrome/quinol oxidase subunit 1
MLSVLKHAARTLPVRRVVQPQSMTIRAFGASAVSEADVVIPEIVDTLEWLLASPPPLHQFEEPPMIVEVAHLM